MVKKLKEEEIEMWEDMVKLLMKDGSQDMQDIYEMADEYIEARRERLPKNRSKED